jgi:hypothetical protein
VKASADFSNSMVKFFRCFQEEKFPPLSRRDPPAYRHPPYQGGQGGSNLKSVFSLIITSYLSAIFVAIIEAILFIFLRGLVTNHLFI